MRSSHGLFRTVPWQSKQAGRRLEALCRGFRESESSVVSFEVCMWLAFGTTLRDMVKRKRERVVEVQVMIGCLEKGHCARSASAEKDPMLFSMTPVYF